MTKLVITVLNLCKDALNKECDKLSQRITNLEDKQEVNQHHLDAELDAAWEEYREKCRRACTKHEQAKEKIQAKLSNTTHSLMTAEKYLSKLS